MNRTERLLDLITYLLNAHEPVSWQEIKNHFPVDYAQGVEESNQRKFERDKAELISLGIPIDYHSGSEFKKEGYIIEKEKLFLPEIGFSARESSLLMLAARAVGDDENFPYSDQLASALHKIISINRQIDPAPVRADLTISYEAGRARNLWIRQIQDALDRRKAVDIDYHAFSTGEVTQRKVDPYGLIFRRGNWTLIGWDHLRESRRNFVLSRIHQLKVNTRKPGTPDYEIPQDFSLASQRNQEPWEIDLHEPIHAVIEALPHRVAEIASRLTSAERLGKGRFRIRVTNKNGFQRWVLSHKTDLKVLSPPEIRDEIRASLRGLI